MKLIWLLLICPFLTAEPYGPWPDISLAPKWWVVLHAPFLPAVQVTPPTPLPPDPSATEVSFSPQGDEAMKAMVGHTIKNIGMDEITICAPIGTTVSGGAVFQLANSLGISTLSPNLTQRIFTRTAALSKQALIYNTAKWGLLAVPIAGQVGLISMSSKIVTSLLVGHGLVDQVQSYYSPLLPDPSPFLTDLLDPQGNFILSGNCKVATMGVEYTGKAAMKNPVRGRYSLTGGRR